jgi:hypothetical protein
MKAINVMLFLLIFNVVISLVGGLHIYNMNVSSEEYDYEDLEDESQSSDTFNTFFIGGTTVGILVGGAVAGGLISGLISGGRIRTAEGAAYGFFAALMTTTFISSYSILWTLVGQVPTEVQGGVAIVVGLFLAVTGFMFILGFMQLIVGGIAQYQ